MKRLLLLHTSAARNTTRILSSDAVRQAYDMISVNYADITGFNSTHLESASGAIDLETIDTIWLDFDWELRDNHINYYHITSLLIAKYADKLAVNKLTFQRYHPIFDDKLFIANVLNYQGIPHPATTLLDERHIAGSARLVVKKRFSGRARDVYLVDSLAELEPHVSQHARDYICQEYLYISQEIRVVVYRGRVVGAVERTAKFTGGQTGKVKLTGEQCTLTTEQTRLCLETAAAVDAELVGLDLAVDTAGRDWMIELNIGADLTGFAKLTGLDLLAEVLLT